MRDALSCTEPRCGHNGGMSDSPAPLADPHLVFDPVDGVRDVVILGSTGSIGTQAIDLVLRNPDRFRVTALSAAGGRVALLAEQAHRLRAADGRRRATRTPYRRSGRPSRERYAPGEPLPEILAGPGRRHRGRRLRLPHRPQRHHRLHRPRAHPRRPGGGPHPRARQQGVAHRRRPAGEGAGQAGPDHPGRLRARRPLPGAGRRHPRGRAQARRHRLRRPLPRPYEARSSRT